MKKFNLFTLLVVFVLCGSYAFAQTVHTPPEDFGQFGAAEIGVVATVLDAVTVEAGDDMLFADVRPGTTVRCDDTPGTFVVLGADPATQVVIGFILPSYLTDGDNYLPIIFGEEDADFEGNRFDPKNGVGGPFDFAGGGTVSIWGTVVANVGQPAGEYTGVITCMVAYTGE